MFIFFSILLFKHPPSTESNAFKVCGLYCVFLNKLAESLFRQHPLAFGFSLQPKQRGEQCFASPENYVGGTFSFWSLFILTPFEVRVAVACRAAS